MSIFLRMESIHGEATTPGYEGWLECGSVLWGCGRAVGMATAEHQREPSELSMSEITVSRQSGPSSPALFATAQSERPCDAEIHLTREQHGVHEVYLIYRLREALVSGYSINSGGGIPDESISLNYTALEIEYRTQDRPTRSFKASWTTPGHA